MDRVTPSFLSNEKPQSCDKTQPKEKGWGKARSLLKFGQGVEYLLTIV
jgi:hypothetical protein